ncbi:MULTISPECIES: bifunctional metallophosphatase/5'-nucleotidase [Dethiosulfovibrio]|uniref:5'-nucleotidase C-terminal domain-containing protein n=2 Tax=Dethiosulfovibrio TaxID=47054 RepID=A0ABS9EJL0_9BACT|nr:MULTISPECIES: 5'-nucleotidase C-terminal domain-containing protein [Dethiosulfovibrio]MCF4112932.1 5'-nucleotidase C-terminal domain-containing protein [Dethiosulfovibrio russensis]MCF4141396.1 5'-nucleotidase C-terminal domain-containing protein [Dethiosulfovibrio marinus]MCF4144351.1 5'-nucleotidase C-terminal domain-containing protein [Dethiosulfovibrio acidaminovorans]
MKRCTVRVGKLFFVLMAIMAFSMPSWGKDGTATIVGFNDMHGKIFSYEATVKVDGEKVKEDVGGIARIASVIREIKSQSPGNVVVAQMGDTVEGPLFFFFHGKAELAGIDAIPVDVGIPGNHEFDLGADVFGQFVRTASFPLICANLETSRDDCELSSTWTITLENGVKVGFFGLLCTELASLTTPGPDIAAGQDLIAVSEKCVEDLRERGCDVIVALTHVGIDSDRKLAESVSGIHAILGGHSHTVMESPEVVEGPDGWKTMIGQAGAMARYVGSMTVTVKEGKLDTEKSSWKLIEMRQSVPKAQDIEIAIKPYGDELKKNLSKKVGTFVSDMDATKLVVRGRESALGDYLADGLRRKAGTDVAFVNGGGIRGDRVFPAGEISYNTIMEIFPWGNTMQTFSFTGAELREVMEISASALKGTGDEYDPAVRAPSGAFLQISGLKVVLDLTKAPALIDNDSKLLRPGARVLSMEIERAGEVFPIEDDKIYTVATYSWTGGGGDKYYPFARKKAVESYVTDSDVLAETIRHTAGIVEKSKDGRIVVKK